ncbi:MAG: precorrin-6y C5,15-methyltransferase (decarboxylating) subunit CbiE [Clostridia bacterium]|nr:precorrin-6y C5,15-methyltransferase (decarboxylating) subunit CbiE [Clostridia bacterium]
MNKLTVIGAGPGGRDMLTAEAAQAIINADAVWCAARNADLVPADKRRALMPFAGALDEMQSALDAGLNAAALLSGDTGLYSMLSLIKRRVGEENVRVICGVSSVQALCARLALSWQDSKIVSAHGRGLAESALCHYARTNPKTLVLLDGERDPKWVRSSLCEGGLEKLKLIIGERLGYDDETVSPYEDRQYDSLCVALIINEAPESAAHPFGLNDESFIRGKTPMTKREIRAQVISEMRLAPDSVVWDVGAGTGSVSIECALQCPLGEVYAVERDADALELIKRNKAAFCALNVHVVSGSAPQALADLPAPTHVFLGGTGGETEEILSALERLNKTLRVCATAVTMESASFFTEALSRYAGFSAVQLQVSRLEKVGRYSMFRAQNPVFVFAATMEESK